jgi:hypothetical protein
MPQIFQCAIPCFENLLPAKHNKVILDLLFILALWHGLAKCRKHIDFTLAIMAFVLTQLGVLLRRFKSQVCTAYETKELAKEFRARARRQAKNTANPDAPGSSVDHKEKKFNLNTPKMHMQGHYISDIRGFGTLDGTSPQTVSPLILHYSF